MFRQILIPLDGSPVAEQVVPLAKMLVLRFQSAVVLLRVIEPIHARRRAEGEVFRDDDQVELLRGSALEYLETVHHDFAAGISVEREVRVGSPATVILDLAESAPVDLIAMATHGHTGLQRWVYGSVADKVLSSARLPILLVRASERPRAFGPIKRILVPLDGSTLAERALIPARQLAKAFDAEVLLLRVWEPSTYVPDGLSAGTSVAALSEAVRGAVEEYLTEKTREMRSQGVRVGWEAPFGMVAENILDVAEKHAVNLVVMSTHGRSGVGRWVMGSVADRVLRASRTPILLIRSGAVVK